jgi:hypothetical protein
MNSNKNKNQRLRLICAFLDKGGGSLKEMKQYVNLSLRREGLDEVGTRTLQSCIEDLRKGNFDHIQSHLPAGEKKNLFKIKFQFKKYHWEEDTEKPIFGDLDADERFSLPFLTGLLKQYESIPAVEKILSQLPEIFNITKAEMESRTAIFHSGPMLHSNSIEKLNEKVIKCVTNILEHIHNQHVIEFNYYTVDKKNNNFSSKNLKMVMPLAIKLYEHYYYLFAQDFTTGWLNNFRIDQIINLKVDKYTDEQGDYLTFNREELNAKHNIEKKLRYSLGVWTYNDDTNLHEIQIVFTGWAASYIKNLKFHETQKTLEERDNETTISFTLNMPSNVNHKNFDIEKSAPELAFLLGRFRSFCKIVKIEKK